MVPLRGDVRFDHVVFGYDEDRTILHDVSLFAKPGEDRLVSLGQMADEAVGSRQTGGGLYFLVCGVQAAVPDVVRSRC